MRKQTLIRVVLVNWTDAILPPEGSSDNEFKLT